MPRKGKVSLITKTKKELEEEKRLEEERLEKEAIKLAGFRNNKHRGGHVLVKKPRGTG